MARSATRDEETDPEGVNKVSKERSDSDANTNSHGNAQNGAQKTNSPKKKSLPAKLWEKTDLDLGTILMMGKAGLPPAIALAIYEADSAARTYTTLGYLVAIMSILGFCIMPRAKFIQTMTMNVLSTCVGAAIGLLMVWSGVQARLNTTDPTAPPQRYNSSQSAVCAIWLFFQIWLVNTLKSKFPQFAFPTIIYAIFVNVASTFGPQFMTTTQAKSFIQRLLETFLSGFAIATGVSLFIFPVTSRKVVKKEMTGFIMALKGALRAHKNYFQSLEKTDMFEETVILESKDDGKSEKPETKPEIEAIKKLTATFTELLGKLHGDLPFAKREIAYGKMTPEDFEALFKHLRETMMPLLGLGSLIDIFHRAAEVNHWHENEQEADDLRRRTVNDWNEIMQLVHEPFGNIIQAMDDGLMHVLLRLQFVKTPKKMKSSQATDAEAKGDVAVPGDQGFALYLEKQADTFYQTKESTLHRWIESKGIKVGENHFENIDLESEDLRLQPMQTRQRNRRQLYILLYIIFLLHSASRSILKLVRFADEKDQAVAKSKLILPGKKRFKKWMVSLFKEQDANHDDETTFAGLERQSTIVYMGEAFNNKKDPEHLAPQNGWENFGNFIRGIAGFLRSPDSAFGFRCACATMSIAIIAFLGDTQRFFTENRLVWAMIMVAISMVPTAGQSVFTFGLRIAGTVVAMIVAWLIWYIPGQKTAGIIVFLWFFVGLGFYIPLKRPDLIIVGIISVVTATMIVGYELQVRKIGEAAATSNGQVFYPIYILGPYRLATVAAGLLVAFFWTFFPFPITEHSALRQKLGGALYLSANYYSIMHETVMARIRGNEGDPTSSTSPGYKLTKARNKVFAKQMLNLQGLRMHSAMIKFEFPLGGKFPKKDYDAITQLVTNIMNYTSLLGYASGSFLHPHFQNEEDRSSTKWFHDFQKIIGSVDLTSHEITSLLALLSSSITNGQPLPPYLKAPHSYQLLSKLEAVDHDILSLRHVAEPGYAAFAVMQISTRCIHQDLQKLLKAVKKLVGELDFSFHTVSTQASSGASSMSTLARSSSHRSKDD